MDSYFQDRRPPSRSEWEMSTHVPSGTHHRQKLRPRENPQYIIYSFLLTLHSMLKTILLYILFCPFWVLESPFIPFFFLPLFNCLHFFQWKLRQSGSVSLFCKEVKSLFIIWVAHGYPKLEEHYLEKWRQKRWENKGKICPLLTGFSEKRILFIICS